MIRNGSVVHQRFERLCSGVDLVDVCERNGNMERAEADEWRRRIVARP